MHHWRERPIKRGDVVAFGPRLGVVWVTRPCILALPIVRRDAYCRFGQIEIEQFRDLAMMGVAPGHTIRCASSMRVGHAAVRIGRVTPQMLAELRATVRRSVESAFYVEKWTAARSHTLCQ